MHPSTEFTLRLRQGDRADLLDHFTALDAADRRLRFGASVSDAGIREYVARIDLARDGLFAVREDAGRLGAVIHVALGGDPAELGLSVLPGFRGQGHGGALFTRAVDYLCNRGTRAVWVHCLSENAAMMHMARRHGMQLASAGGESDGRLVLAPPTPDSFFREWLHDQQAAAVALMRRYARLAVYMWGWVPRP